MVRRLGSTILILSLTGCSYRYGAGYFAVNEQQPAPVTSQQIPPPEPVAEDCEQTIEQLEVTNKLDNTNNTITTTAVTKRDRTRKCP
jgi:hypothetical protein